MDNRIEIGDKVICLPGKELGKIISKYDGFGYDWEVKVLYRSEFKGRAGVKKDCFKNSELILHTKCSHNKDTKK